jgi:5-methylcytosine-specific restriction endonuclease McrA
MARQTIASESVKCCSKCGVSKELDLFVKAASCKGGRAGVCKACKSNLTVKWQRSSEGYKTSSQAYYQANKDVINARGAQYQKDNRARYTAHSASHRARKLLATVSWSCEEAILAIYEEASRLGLEVDHIIPLNGELVSGLHCEDNLQLLTSKENRVKGNKYGTTNNSLRV